MFKGLIKKSKKVNKIFKKVNIYREHSELEL